MNIGTDILTEKNVLNAQNIQGESKCNKSEKNAVNKAKEPLGQPIMDLDENSACGYELLGKDDGAENKGA